MEKRQAKKKILWAVDPFAKEKGLQSATARVIQELVKTDSVEIEPVYVISGDSFDLPAKLPSNLIQELRSSADEELKEILRKIKLPGLKPLRLLSETGESLSECANALLDYARAVNADLIVLSTRARKGPKRWLLGSFAETLLLASDVPLLVVNPFEDRTPNFKNILFPTDFSKESKIAFKRVLQFAKSRKSKITLFHKVNLDWMIGLGPAFAAYPEYRKIYAEDLASKKAEAESWVLEAKGAGIAAVSFFDMKKGDSAAEAILKRSTQKGGMIAMVARSGSVASTLLGSTARKVIREANAPVWVLHASVDRKVFLKPKKSKKRESHEYSLTFNEKEVEDLTHQEYAPTGSSKVKRDKR